MGSDADDGEQGINVEMPREKWDVVLHVLEEEMAQLAPPDGDWLGKYPGEESAVAVGEVHEEIARSLHTGNDREEGQHGD